MAENLLSAFQIHFVVSVTIVCLLWYVASALGTGVTLLKASVLCGLALLLPTCGGTTLAFAPAVFALLIAMVFLLPSHTPRKLAVRLLLLGTAVALAILCLRYFHEFQATEALPWTLVGFLRAVCQFTGTAWGPGPGWATEIFGAATVLLGAAAGLTCARFAFLSRANERLVWVAWLALLIGSGMLVAAVSGGRGLLGRDWAVTPRYASLLSPLVAGVAVVLSHPKLPKLVRWAVPLLACCALLLLPANAKAGYRIGNERRTLDRAFASDVARGVPLNGLVSRYAGDYGAGMPEVTRKLFRQLIDNHLGPFRELKELPLQGPTKKIDLLKNQPELHDLTQLPDGSFEVAGPDPYFVLQLERMEIEGLEIGLKMTRPSSDVSLTGTRLYWADHKAQPFPTEQGCWMHLQLPSSETMWRFWIYDHVKAIKIAPDWRPYRLKLTSASALLSAD